MTASMIAPDLLYGDGDVGLMKVARSGIIAAVGGLFMYGLPRR